MKRFFGSVLLFGLLMMGCAAGKNFTRPLSNNLEYGVTTLQQVIAQYGQPYNQSSVTENNEQIKILNYAYAHSGGEPYFKGVTPARGMSFGFHENKLVSYNFTSSFKYDSTYYPEDIIDRITKSKTTKSELYKIIGNPIGHSIYPAIKEKDTVADVYNYGQTRMSGLTPKIYSQLLIVTYDTNDVISNIVFNTNGTK